MKFLEILKELEKEEKNDCFIILIRCGAFFVAVGNDAMLLSKELGLKRICMKESLCKIGIPFSSIYNYIKKLEDLDYKFVIYNYSKDEMIENGKSYAESYVNIGKKSKEENIIVNCKECQRYENNINYNAIDIFDELNRIKGLKKAENKIEKNKNSEWNRNMNSKELILIPKYEAYMQYMIEVIIKMPRTEKFNIGNDFKSIMYRTLENILYINKIENSKRIYYLNLIDAGIIKDKKVLWLTKEIIY